MKYIHLDTVYVTNIGLSTLILKSSQYKDGIEIEVPEWMAKEIEIAELMLQKTESLNIGKEALEKGLADSGYPKPSICRIYLRDESFEAKLSTVEGEINEEKILAGELEKNDSFVSTICSAIALGVKFIIDEFTYNAIIDSKVIFVIEEGRLSKDVYENLSDLEILESVSEAIESEDYKLAANLKSILDSRYEETVARVTILIMANEYSAIEELLAPIKEKGVILNFLNQMETSLLENKFKTSTHFSTDEEKSFASKAKFYEVMRDVLKGLPRGTQMHFNNWRQCLEEYNEGNSLIK